jgi:glycosyltransferase involved in cell wall biosynthesis
MQPTGDIRPLVAIVANVQTPYRLHLHRRIVTELAGVRLASLYTHDAPDQPWGVEHSPEINPVLFGAGEPVSLQGTPRMLASDLRKGARMIRWLRENGARAVVIGGYNDATRLRLIRWCARAGVPCFVTADATIHTDRVRGIKRLVKRTLVRWVVRSCAGVLPCGSLGALYFARYGARPERTFFFPYEPDYGLVQDVSPADLAVARERFSLSPERRRLVVCARLIPVKRVDLAIDAFAAIASQRTDWDLVVIGDGPLRAGLEARVPGALATRVRWTGFIGDQAVVSAIYRCSDVLLCPSDYEPWGVVINEAAASGLAIVASDVVGAAAELVRDGVNGRSFPSGDLAALTGALLDVTDPARLRSLRTGTAAVLSDWRQRGDPVDGLRKALVATGVLSTQRALAPHVRESDPARPPASPSAGGHRSGGRR